VDHAAREHTVSYTVYYEDTDSLGVVYYANYLRFMERGRSELLASTGRTVADWNALGHLLVVHSLTMKFKRAAKLSDRLDVVTSVTSDSPYRITFRQRIERAGELITTADVVVVCLDTKEQLTEIPDGLRALASG
jgi:tol-pal system-associated acyl-CoA thioesterase